MFWTILTWAAAIVGLALIGSLFGVYRFDTRDKTRTVTGQDHIEYAFQQRWAGRAAMLALVLFGIGVIAGSALLVEWLSGLYASQPR